MIIIRLYFVVFVIAATVAPIAAETITSVFISDIHFDPYYGSGKGFKCTNQAYDEFGTLGCDTPFDLLASMVNDASPLNAQLTFLTGDWLRHRMDLLPSTDISQTITTVVSSIAPLANHTFVTSPSGILIGAAGNNDVIPDYEFDVSASSDSAPLRLFASVMESYSLLSRNESRNFSACGYYYRDLNRSTPLRVIVLNSLLWSVSLVPDARSTADPCGQFAFLSKMLATLPANGRAILLAHIPPGNNVHVNLVNQEKENFQLFWYLDYQRAFVQVVKSYSKSISFCLFGHTHMYSWIADRSVGVPIFIVPSISPAFGNVPSYLIATIDDSTWAIKRLVQRYFDVRSHVWENGEELGSLFHVELTLDDLNGLSQVFATTKKLSMTPFVSLYTGGTLSMSVFPDSACTATCLQILACSTYLLDPGALRECVQLVSVFEVSAATATVVFTVLSSVMFLYGLGYLLFKRKSLMLHDDVEVFSGEGEWERDFLRRIADGKEANRSTTPPATQGGKYVPVTPRFGRRADDRPLSVDGIDLF